MITIKTNLDNRNQKTYRVPKGKRAHCYRLVGNYAKRAHKKKFKSYISEKKVRVMLSKEKRCVNGSLSPDRRGQGQPPNKLSQNDIEYIRYHLSLLPKVPAYWCQKDSSKIYLEGFNLKKSVYDLYLSYAIKNGYREVSETTYYEQLEELKIGFHQPRKDQCWCAGFCKLIDDKKAEKQSEYDLHIKWKNAASDQKKLDTKASKKSTTTMTAVFDMEAILYSPFFKTKQLFYRRKLATHNFTIFNIGKNDGYCYIWPEYDGKKNSQEISTCLAKFIKDEVPTGVETLNLYADNCADKFIKRFNCSILHLIHQLITPAHKKK